MEKTVKRYQAKLKNTSGLSYIIRAYSIEEAKEKLAGFIKDLTEYEINEKTA